jgi:hypothetical protein
VALRRDRPFSRGTSRRDRFRFVAASRAPRSRGGPCQRCYCPCSLMGPCGPAQIDTGCQCSPQRSVPGAHFRPYAHRPCVSSKKPTILLGGSALSSREDRACNSRCPPPIRLLCAASGTQRGSLRRSVSQFFRQSPRLCRGHGEHGKSSRAKFFDVVPDKRARRRIAPLGASVDPGPIATGHR